MGLWPVFAELVLSYLLAALFLVSGIAKVLRIADFREAVAGYNLVASSMVGPIATAVPAMELTIGMAFVIGAQRLVVALLAGTMVLVFTMAVVVNLWRGRRIDCGCYGISRERRTGWPTVSRNVMFLIATLCLVVIARSQSPTALDSQISLPAAIVVTTILAIAQVGSVARQVRESAQRITVGNP